MVKPTRFLSCALVVAAVSLSACGDDDDDTGSSAPASEPAQPSSSTSAGGSAASTTDGASEGSSAASGEPITIGIVGPFDADAFALPELRDGVEVAVEEINASGGIDGRPIEVDACNDNFQAAQASDCFRRLADDQDVLAIVGAGTPFAVASASVIEAAELPFIGPVADPFSLVNPLVVLTNGGQTIEVRALGIVAAERGGPRVAIMRLGIPEQDVSEQATRDGVEAAGGTVTNVVAINVTDVDLAPAAARLMEGNPDAIVLGGLETQQQALIQLLRQDGYEGLITVPVSQTRPAFIEAMGELSEGLVGVSVTAPIQAADADAPGLVALREAIAKHSPDTPLSGYTVNSWLAAQLFAEAANAVEGDLTRESILAAARSLSDVDTGGLTPSLDLSATGPLPEYPNVTNTTYTVVEAQGGKWVWDGKFYDAVNTSSAPG